MTKRVSASEAKNRLGAIMDWAVEHEDEIVIEKRGDPRVVIMPFEQYQKLMALQERARRQEMLSQLQQIVHEVQARNQDLSSDEAEALAEEIGEKTIERMALEGKIKFQKSPS